MYTITRLICTVPYITFAIPHPTYTPIPSDPPRTWRSYTIYTIRHLTYTILHFIYTIPHLTYTIPTSLTPIFPLSSAEALAKHLQSIVHNSTAYMKMHEWRKHGGSDRFKVLVDMQVRRICGFWG